MSMNLSFAHPGPVRVKTFGVRESGKHEGLYISAEMIPFDEFCAMARKMMENRDKFQNADRKHLTMAQLPSIRAGDFTVRTGCGLFFFEGPFKIRLMGYDFFTMVHYVLTNTNLYQDDPRPNFYEWVRSLPLSENPGMDFMQSFIGQCKNGKVSDGFTLSETTHAKRLDIPGIKPPESAAKASLENWF